MVIENISLYNFRGFKNLDIDFHPELNVFIGANAAGKTSILDAIVKSGASMTGTVVGAGNSESFKLIESDINYESTFCEIYSRITFKEEGFSYSTEMTIGTKSDSNLGGKNVALKLPNLQPSKFIQKFKYGPRTVPIFKFFPTSMNNLQYVKPRNFVYNYSQLEVWSNIISNNVNYSKFLSWFVDKENNELRLQRDNDNDPTLVLPELKSIRLAVKLALKELYNKEYDVKSSMIQRAGNNQLIPTLTVNLSGSSINENLANKSDGEKTIITLVSDIAYNLSIAKDYTHDNEVLNSTGIILIDEIESHLHPNWQRKIIGILRNVFPRIQFFITTHSPQILASVTSQNVFVCDNFKVEQSGFKVNNLDSNLLLKYLFGSPERPIEIDSLISSFNEKMSNSATAEELQEIIDNIAELESYDSGQPLSLLITELKYKLESYKFEKEENEAD